MVHTTHGSLKVCSTAKKRATDAAQLEAESLSQPYYIPHYNSISANHPLSGGGGSSGSSANSNAADRDGASAASDSAGAVNGAGDDADEDPRPKMGERALSWLRAAVAARDDHFGSATFPWLLEDGKIAKTAVGRGGGGGGGGSSDGGVSDRHADADPDGAADGAAAADADLDGAAAANTTAGKDFGKVDEAGGFIGPTWPGREGGGIRSAKAVKHAAQESAVVDHLRAAKMLDDAGKFCFLEFGAAQGGLGQAIRRNLAGSTVVLIERDVYGKHHPAGIS